MPTKGESTDWDPWRVNTASEWLLLLMKVQSIYIARIARAPAEILTSHPSSIKFDRFAVEFVSFVGASGLTSDREIS